MDNKPTDSDSSVMAVANDSLLAVLAPVLDWYQSDEQPAREPLDILRDIVNDLQSDRAEVMALRAQIGKPPEGSHPDERWPRSATWHEERRAWLIEVERLKAALSSANASVLAHADTKSPTP